MMWPFRRRPTVPCCPDTVRVALAVEAINRVLVDQSELHEHDRNVELLDVALEVRDLLTSARAKRRSR